MILDETELWRLAAQAAPLLGDAVPVGLRGRSGD